MIPAADVPAALSLAQRAGVVLTPIGRMSAGSGVRICDEDGREMAIGRTYY